MEMLKQYDEWLTNKLDEIHDDLVFIKPIYRGIDCDWHEYMRDLYQYSIKSFIDWYEIPIQTIKPYRDDFKRTYNNNGRVIDWLNGVRELMIDSKLREIDSDFQ